MRKALSMTQRRAVLNSNLGLEPRQKDIGDGYNGIPN